jgi:hypothetical protein
MSNCPRREPYFSPPFSHILPPTDLICVISIWIVYILVKNILPTKMGQNGAVLGEILHFGKTAKGCQKRWKTKFHQIWFSALLTAPCYVRSTSVLFWGEKKPWLGCCGPKREISVPKFELRFCSGHWGGPFCLKLCEPSSYIIWTWFAPKKSNSRTFAQMTTSGILRCKQGSAKPVMLVCTSCMSCMFILVSVHAMLSSKFLEFQSPIWSSLALLVNPSRLLICTLSSRTSSSKTLLIRWCTLTYLLLLLLLLLGLLGLFTLI